jgi:uncharacterized membrane protein
VHRTKALSAEPRNEPVEVDGGARGLSVAPRPIPPRTPYPLGPATLAVAILSAVGASLALCLATWLVPRANLSQFYDDNDLAKSVRTFLFLALLAGGFASALLSGIYLLARGRGGVPALRRAADVALPFGLAFLLPSLFAYDPWHKKPLTYLIELAIAVLLLERTLRRSLRAMPEPLVDWIARTLAAPRAVRWLPLFAVIAGSVFYAIYFSYYTILNHYRLNTSGFDLGINVNWCYNALHGHPTRSTVLFGPSGGHFLGNHAIFGMALWLPIYAIKPGAEVLLIFQSAMAGLAAVPLFLFASTQLPRWSAVVVAYAYLFFAPLHGPNFYDYHELIPPLFFHFLLYWALARDRTWLAALLVPVLWSFREDVAVGLVVLGFFLAITGIRPRFGLAMALISGIWFVLLKFVVMPMYWQTWFANIYKELQAPGQSGYGTVVETILINPSYFLKTLLDKDKLIYFLHMFAPLAFLPARRPALLLLAIPGFTFSLLTTGYAPTLSIGFQYTCHSIPYVFAASVLMLRLLGRGEGGVVRRRAVLGAVVLGVLSHSYVFGAVLQHNTFVGGFSKVEFTMTSQEQARYQALRRMAAMIPESASVAAGENEVPHVAARLNAYTLKLGPADADYILVYGDRARSGPQHKTLQTMFSREEYGLLTKAEGLFLFKRGHSSPETPAALKALNIRSTARAPKSGKPGKPPKAAPGEPPPR